MSTTPARGTTGVVLLAHGARDPRWAAPFETVARRLREIEPAWRVANAYLELMAPTLADAAATLEAAGCTRIVVLPMFLGAGGHVRQDLPALVAALRSAKPHLRVELLDAIGEQPTVLATMSLAAAALVREAFE